MLKFMYIVVNKLKSEGDKVGNGEFAGYPSQLQMAYIQDRNSYIYEDGRLLCPDKIVPICVDIVFIYLWGWTSFLNAP